MGVVHKKNGGLRNLRLILYTVMSILPLIISAGFLLLGPDDLSGRMDLFDYFWVVNGYLAVSFLFCIVFLCTKQFDLTANTRIMMVLSTIVATTVSWFGFLGSVYATV